MRQGRDRDNLKVTVGDMTVEGNFSSLPSHIRRLVEDRLGGGSSSEPEVVYRDRIVYRDRDTRRDDYSYHN